MRNFVTVAAATAVASSIAIPSVAFAQEDDGHGVYGSVNIGGASVNDVRVTYYDAAGTFGGAGPGSDSLSMQFETKNAVIFGGTLGYDAGPVRVDVEVSYARNRIRGVKNVSVNGTAAGALDPADVADLCDYLEIDDCAASGTTGVRFGGGPRVRQLNAMVNGWYDIPVSPSVEPYVGVGLGVAGFEIEGEGKAKFAWQVGAGVAFNLSPSAAVTFDLRHRQASKIKFDYDAVSGLNIGKIKTTSASVGLRFKF